MVSNIENLDISKTFANILLSNIDEQPDGNGIPFDFSTPALKNQGRVQDGSGNSSPLFLSRTSVEVESIPESLTSVIRKQEILEGITYLQTASIIYG